MRVSAFISKTVRSIGPDIEIEIDAAGFQPLDFDLKKEQKKELLERGTNAVKLLLLEYQLEVQKARLAEIEAAKKTWFSEEAIVSMTAKVCKIALEEFPELEVNQITFNQFCLEMKHCLEKIYRSILYGDEDFDTLRQIQTTKPISAPFLYIKILKLIQDELSIAALSSEVKKAINKRIDYIKGRMS